MVNPRVHFIFFDELASLGGPDAPLNRLEEPPLLIHKANDNVGDKLLGLRAGAARQSCNLRLLLRGEMYFHAIIVPATSVLGNRLLPTVYRGFRSGARLEYAYQ